MALQVQPRFEFIRLDTKPSSRISYSFSPATRKGSGTSTLVVFLNGLGLPQAGWTPTILKLRQLAGHSTPAILTYDRYGQGRTVDRDPLEDGAIDPAHSHDCVDAVHDMHQLINQVASQTMQRNGVDSLRLVLVSNDIGCAIARLYAQTYPQTVAGIMFLDSSITNTDFVSLFPDPDAPLFNNVLPPNVKPDALRYTRARVGTLYHPDVPNKEGLSRRSLVRLLPRSDSPRLVGPNGRGPYITVISHDAEVFAQQTKKTLGIPTEVTHAYLNPVWDMYSRGLVLLTEPGRRMGPFQAPGTGNFMQADNPGFVADRLFEMLQKVEAS